MGGAPGPAQDRGDAVLDLTREERRGERRARVLLVDDHALLADGVAMALRREGLDALIAPTTDSVSVRHACHEFQPHVVLLDLMLQGGQRGLDLIGSIREVSAARILMLTGITDEIELAKCLEAGADGLLSKARPLPEIVTMVLEAAQGEPVIRERERHQLLADLRHHRAQERERTAPFDELTRREAEILAHLTEGRSPQEIAEVDFVSVGTVRSQLKVLFRKLGVRSQLAAVTAAHEIGWTHEPTAASR